MSRQNNALPEAVETAERMSTLFKGICVILPLLLLLTILPVQKVNAASGRPLELTLKVGSTAAKVNGKNITIQQPFIKNGTVMVPLGVFKKAFGSTVTLEQNDVVKVMYGPHTGAMVIGSTTAWKDGSKMVLTAPPQMVSGVLMVPLRFVAGVLGARITPGDGGGLVISLVPPENEEEIAESSIDSNVGKTRIGNSYYQWSLNYPSGLVVGDSGGNEAIATFVNTENLYYLEIHASPQQSPVDPEELLDGLVRAAQEGEETILDRTVHPEAKVPYARIVSKDSGGALWEGRQYYADGRLYELYLTDDSAANYKDLDKYASLLNSFQPVFDPADTSIRDLSTVKNGLREGYNEDYGIALHVPADWRMDDQHLLYESGKGSHLLAKVTSAPSGSTLKSWEEELEARIRDSYVSDAYTIRDSVTAEISGEPALVKEIQLGTGDDKSTEYQVLLLKNGYRYYVEYVAAAGQAKDKEKFKEILASIDIDFAAISQNFGRLESDDYTALRSKTVTKSSKTYGYSIKIPRLWTAYQDLFEMQNVDYRFTGGRLQINVNPEGSVEYTAGTLQSYYQNSKKDPDGPLIESVEESVFAGVPATVLTVHQNKGGVPARTQIIVFSKNDLVFTVTVTLNDINATAAQQALIEKTLQSFRLMNKGE
ncbi:stalk domain-containing protein [Paenibacillus sp. PK3_47]|uniref:stalk domain-containing protein n=1 Tax=Paenibacillus sp. PK3_47 TaxID=2072642 RepID=UPI00201D7EB5|nr:stalk domain-containing protein [Paenibacillus sp. PK3_47]